MKIESHLKLKIFLLLLFPSLILVDFVEAQEANQERESELFSYVGKDDGLFKWELLSRKNLPEGIKLHELEFISQKWQGIKWKHHLSLIVPDNFKEENPHVLVGVFGSGRNFNEILLAGKIAKEIGSPMAILYDIPNQPLFGALREDDLIAYTFVKYLETEDSSWPLLLPMTKAVVKAMDAIQEHIEKELDKKVGGFVITGGSKRGWTTWLTSAVDERVKGIIPSVYDNLNLIAQMKHQKAVWGNFSPAIEAYTKKNIPDILISGNSNAEKLAEIVDPFTYVGKINIPKYIMIGTNDPYWPLDALNLYYDDLKSPKYIYYMPDSGHSLEKFPEIRLKNIIAFYRMIQGDFEFPEIEFDKELQKNGCVVTLCTRNRIPKEVYLWQADVKTRDFRNSKWEKREIIKDGKFNEDKKIWTLKKELEKLEENFRAAYIELVYEENGLQYNICTQLVILEPLSSIDEKKKSR